TPSTLVLTMSMICRKDSMAVLIAGTHADFQCCLCQRIEDNAFHLARLSFNPAATEVGRVTPCAPSFVRRRLERLIPIVACRGLRALPFPFAVVRVSRYALRAWICPSAKSCLTPFRNGCLTAVGSLSRSTARRRAKTNSAAQTL